MILKTGKEEILYLLTKVIDKFESETGSTVIRNTNRKNYEAVALRLSEISNALPETAETLSHEPYPPDYNPKGLGYPLRKYDITSGQIKDGYFGMVSNPRPFLLDACYIYLFGTGRKGFQENPADPNLLKDDENHNEHDEADLLRKDQELLKEQMAKMEDEKQLALLDQQKKHQQQKRIWIAVSFLLLLLAGTVIFLWKRDTTGWNTMRKEMNILSYTPTKAEIDSLEGIWLCYTGSPQARISDNNRYHMVVANVLDVKYHDGYFTFTRYGASFDHIGYMQFEAPWLVSIHSYVRNGADRLESPRHSLMRLDREKTLLSVISASWNFDVGSRNNIIGIREVYIKQGKGGNIEEVINTVENASCRCKIVSWTQTNGEEKKFLLRNELLDNLSDTTLQGLLNEKSILLRVPQQGLILSDSIKR
jgi:hypothetical protein